MMTTTTISNRPEKKVAVSPKASTPTKSQSTNPNRSALLLKSAVVIGSIVATILGANLAAQEDQSIATVVSSTSTASTASSSLGAPQQVAAVPNLAGNPALDAVLNTQLAPIPTINIPAVVSTSQSSR